MLESSKQYTIYELYILNAATMAFNAYQHLLLGDTIGYKYYHQKQKDALQRARCYKQKN